MKAIKAHDAALQSRPRQQYRGLAMPTANRPPSRALKVEESQHSNLSKVFAAELIIRGKRVTSNERVGSPPHPAPPQQVGIWKNAPEDRPHNAVHKGLHAE
jgi:hypothetical protein